VADPQKQYIDRYTIRVGRYSKKYIG